MTDPEEDSISTPEDTSAGSTGTTRNGGFLAAAESIGVTGQEAGHAVDLNALIFNRAYAAAARSARGSLGRLAGAAVCQAAGHTLTVDEARQALRDVPDPAVRDAAATLLEQLAEEAAITRRTAP